MSTSASACGYEAVSGWGGLPNYDRMGEVAGVATDADNRVFVFNRSDHPVLIFDPDGRLVSSWGEGVFRRAHGLQIGPDGSVYCTDDMDHTVRKFTPDGRLLMTLGTSGQRSDTGVSGNDYRTIRRGAPPFNQPTNLAIAPGGDLYVSDGYGNARVHRFSPDGRLLASWGEPGAAPGQFNLPHGIAVDRHGRVYVADRENSRVQVFSPNGEFLAEWTDVTRPCQVFIGDDDRVYVAELGFHVGVWPGNEAPEDPPAGRVSIRDRDGSLLGRWGGGDNPREPDNFLAPHDIWVDGEGSIYVGEVTISASRNSPIAREVPPLRKFRRLP